MPGNYDPEIHVFHLALTVSNAGHGVPYDSCGVQGNLIIGI